jgi:hypothetical protein
MPTRHILNDKDAAQRIIAEELRIRSTSNHIVFNPKNKGTLVYEGELDVVHYDNKEVTQYTPYVDILASDFNVVINDPKSHKPDALDALLEVFKNVK